MLRVVSCASSLQHIPGEAVMKSCRVLASAALVTLGLMLDPAHAQSRDAELDAIANVTAVDVPGDLILDDSFEGERNGATSCETATELSNDTTFGADTTIGVNWMHVFGPLLSPANDVVYTFTAGPDVDGFITPTFSNFPFAMYLLDGCMTSGTEAAPIGATATIGRAIDLAASGVVSGRTYYLAITGVSAFGTFAVGTLNFTTPPSLIASAKR
jgi:hypothetical protein